MNPPSAISQNTQAFTVVQAPAQPQAGCWLRVCQTIRKLQSAIFTSPGWGGGPLIGGFGIYQGNNAMLALGVAFTVIGVVGAKRFYTLLTEEVTLNKEDKIKDYGTDLSETEKKKREDNQEFKVIVAGMDQETSQAASRNIEIAADVDQVAKKVQRGETSFVQGVKNSTSQLNATIQGLQKKNEDLQTQLETARKTIGSIDQERVALVKNVDALKNVIEQLLAARNQLSDQLANLQQQLIQPIAADSSAERVGRFETIIKNQRARIEELTETCKNLLKQVNELKSAEGPD